MILVIDNYDSFTFNLVQLLQVAGATVDVRRNDAIDLAGVRALDPEGVLLSPGPGRPEHAGVTPVLARALDDVPLLGVCLGHQALAAAHGAAVVRAPRLMHGRTSPVHHDGRGLFEGLPSPLTATRYHSLIVDEATVDGDALEITARTAEGEVMGLRHRSRPAWGVQFHPESFLSEEGPALLGNFLRACRSAA
jgi:anthranilate synthase/aminodeoxychorismate synthase-like glutamine amidotransferase